nr:MAG TPA: hypothetical protein [Caudoviricetes sp.]
MYYLFSPPRQKKRLSREESTKVQQSIYSLRQ